MQLRHERKHEISPLDLLILRQRLRAVAAPDPHGAEGKYLVRSLYFDTPEDKALREKLDGVARREKFRVRYYDGDPSTVHLEKKSKVNGLGWKESAPLSPEEVKRLLAGDCGWMAGDGRPLVEELFQKNRGRRLAPRTIVDYTREAFLHPAGNALDKEAVLRYFVVHNFAVNGDSYTGAMIHNYYLYERDGRLAMIPWDYNLAFGGFQNGSASSAVNDPIDDALEDRLMQSWIFASQQDTDWYHRLYREFLDSVDIQEMIDQAAALIAPYVERDPTKFCTAEEFHAGVEALKAFCRLRAESAAGQLSGEVPSTAAGQQAEPDRLIDTETLNLSDMGSMNMGGNRGGFPGVGQVSAGLPEDFGAVLPGQTGESPPRQGGFPFGGPGQPVPEGGMSSPEGGIPNQESGFPNLEGGMPKRENGLPNQGGLPNQPEESRVGASSGGIPLAVSAAALLAGLVFAQRYRR